MQKECCSRGTENNSTIKSGFFRGLIYGLIPHGFCILFVVSSVIGATIGTVFFKKILLIPYLFPLLICLSFIFATASAIIYLKRNDLLSVRGVKRKWKYFSILYGVTILVNLLFFYVIFPSVANLDLSGRHITLGSENLSSVILGVDIPCSGHAPLIVDELQKIGGVRDVKFKLPNWFEITYDSTKTSQNEILSLDVFKTYKAVVQYE